MRSDIVPIIAYFSGEYSVGARLIKSFRKRNRIRSSDVRVGIGKEV